MLCSYSVSSRFKDPWCLKVGKFKKELQGIHPIFQALGNGIKLHLPQVKGNLVCLRLPLQLPLLLPQGFLAGCYALQGRLDLRTLFCLALQVQLPETRRFWWFCCCTCYIHIDCCLLIADPPSSSPFFASSAGPWSSLQVGYQASEKVGTYQICVAGQLAGSCQPRLVGGCKISGQRKATTFRKVPRKCDVLWLQDSATVL